MKTILKTIAIMVLMALATSCTDNFEELDRPKTTSNVIDPAPLFTRALITGSGLSVGVWQWQHQIAGSVYAQHFANIQIGANFTSDNYEPRAWNLVWDWYYARPNFASLHYNHHVIKLTRELENPIREAIARIWNVYMIQQLTDMYGDIAVSEAFTTIRPAFDPQKDIYLFMLEELKTSVEMIRQFENSGFPGFRQADVLFSGNLDHWARFANTMTLRLALRASNTDIFEGTIRPQFLNDLEPGITMTSQNHTAFIVPDADGPTFHVRNPLAFVHGWNEIRLSKTMFDIMDGLQDPRLMVFASPNEFGEIVGLQNGQPHSLLAELNNSYFIPNYSNIGEAFTQPYTPHFLVTWAESAFLRAEAAQRGLISGSAESFYNEGIRASFEQFGFTDQEVITSYLEGEAKFDPAKALEQIWTQRWIALFPNGHEAWSVVRRTGTPQMMQPVFTFPGNEEMPRRKPYPDSESQYNAENYQRAVARMGGDSQYTRMWWDGGN